MFVPEATPFVSCCASRRITQTPPIVEVCLLQFADADAKALGLVKGSPVVDSNLFFGFEHPLSASKVEGGQQLIGWVAQVISTGHTGVEMNLRESGSNVPSATMVSACAMASAAGSLRQGLVRDDRDRE
jgi:hypothetical protein